MLWRFYIYWTLYDKTVEWQKIAVFDSCYSDSWAELIAFSSFFPQIEKLELYLSAVFSHIWLFLQLDWSVQCPNSRVFILNFVGFFHDPFLR